MSLSKFTTEMVQVGAVANVIVEDIDTPSTNGDHIGKVLAKVADERLRQIEKWGAQSQTPPVWMIILMEEVGEAADELELRDIEDPELRSLIATMGILGRRSKRYLKKEFGWD